MLDILLSMPVFYAYLVFVSVLLLIALWPRENDATPWRQAAPVAALAKTRQASRPSLRTLALPNNSFPEV